ncbi:efflux RND transporter periplasmic adaptor subunit [Limnohabitans sp. T6-5]|uniref:efflux RND transporter periplasmic adaptor subunit n=1 Tax=Limnohabitans sp. T6-5 TaxID=1100724 RepID=UPI001304C9DC|nr:efflux RND transporter periplasmic adaptor subunit [Limnohabitans sp. T6-5]
MLSLAWVRKYRWHMLVGVALLLAAAVGGRWWMGPQVEALSVVRRDLVQTVVATGRVQTPHRVDIGAQITATVARVGVTEGQKVRQGEVLIELVSTELNALQQQADMAVVQAQGRLRQLQELQAPLAQQTLRQAQAQWDLAQANWQRQNELFDQGFVGQAARDESRKALALAEAQVVSARKQMESASPSGSEHVLATGAVSEAQANAQTARARARYARIAAPVDGQIITRNVEAGDVVQAGKVLLTLSPEGRTQLIVQIDEKNLHWMALGQQALASADAYAQQRFKAVVAFIHPGVNAQTGAVEVRLDVPEAPGFLKQDMTVSVDMEVARRQKAVALPVNVVHDISSAAPWVWLVVSNRAVHRPVNLGLRGGAWVEVLEGVREGDAVIDTPLILRAGQRVRLQAASVP